MSLEKSSVTLGGEPLAAVGGFVWRFTGGVSPYVTVASFHRSSKSSLAGRLGQPLDLIFRDSRGNETRVRQVYALHEAPAPSANLVNYVLADKRWFWPYELVARDYNIPRKTGELIAANKTPVPQNQVTVPQYDFFAYSLNGNEEPWTAQEALEDILKQLEDSGQGRGGYAIDSFPLEDAGGSTEFSLQNVTLRDPGDVALARMLSYIPGTDLWVDAEGVLRVNDATDMQGAEEYLDELSTRNALSRTGEYPAGIDRKHIRPPRVFVYYQKEVEALFDFEDDWAGNTIGTPDPMAPYIENVMVTVDPKTTVTDYDPSERAAVTKENVLPGTYVQARQLLAAWADSVIGIPGIKYSVESVRRGWLTGHLAASFGVEGSGDTPDATYLAITERYNSLRKHFRQTFRINRNYTERVREMKNVRAALLDPVTGARQPAVVWSQATLVPSNKFAVARRGPIAGEGEEYSELWRNLDYLYPSSAAGGGAPLLETPISPAAMTWVDKEIGVFRMDWLPGVFGLEDSFVPGLTTAETGGTNVPVRNLALQDDGTIATNAKVMTVGGPWLAPRMYAKVLFTIVPAGRTKEQFHRIEVGSSEVNTVFKNQFGVTGGEGPDLHVFVPPGEFTARFGISDVDQATETLKRVVGLVERTEEEQNADDQMPGYELVNQERSLRRHATAVAAEAMSEYANGIEGSVDTIMPEAGPKIVGNMSSASLRVSSSGKIDVNHEFPGRQRRISRMGLLPESTRNLVYGILKSN